MESLHQAAGGLPQGQNTASSEDQRQKIGCILYDMVQKQYSDLSKQYWAKVTGMLLQSKPLDVLERALDNKPVVQEWIKDACEFLISSLQAARTNLGENNENNDGSGDSSSSESSDKDTS